MKNRKSTQNKHLIAACVFLISKKLYHLTIIRFINRFSPASGSPQNKDIKALKLILPKWLFQVFLTRIFSQPACHNCQVGRLLKSNLASLAGLAYDQVKSSKSYKPL